MNPQDLSENKLEHIRNITKEAHREQVEQYLKEIDLEIENAAREGKTTFSFEQRRFKLVCCGGYVESDGFISTEVMNIIIDHYRKLEFIVTFCNMTIYISWR